mmetsp:Transcript_1244/g.4653  ORF Transcript_1244/g.4653 Transcript_1244/m.4653 type:complete len:277 (+) Transcript_1244:351-1181(+)
MPPRCARARHHRPETQHRGVERGARGIRVPLGILRLARRRVGARGEGNRRRRDARGGWKNKRRRRRRLGRRGRSERRLGRSERRIGHGVPRADRLAAPFRRHGGALREPRARGRGRGPRRSAEVGIAGAQAREALRDERTRREDALDRSRGGAGAVVRERRRARVARGDRDADDEARGVFPVRVLRRGGGHASVPPHARVDGPPGDVPGRFLRVARTAAAQASRGVATRGPGELLDQQPALRQGLFRHRRAGVRVVRGEVHEQQQVERRLRRHAQG